MNITKEKHIYKYSPVNEYLLRNLINNELYFANPIHFNDPFDCQFKLKMIKGSEAEKQFLNNLNVNESEFKNFEVYETEISKGLEDSFNEGLLEKIGVTCFSEKPDNFLMWSHYGNSHQGICLKFDWNVHPDFFQGKKIRYTKELPDINYFSTKGFHNSIGKIVTSKLDYWKYENEIRSIIQIGKSGKRNLCFNPKSLVGIIFGNKISKENIEIIMRIIKLHDEYSNIQFYKSELTREKRIIKISEFV